MKGYIKSGSDLSLNETSAKNVGDKWLLNGFKYFASNVGIADYVLVSAKYDESKGIKGLALFKEFELKNSEAYLIGDLENGIYYILEMLMYSRLDNSIGAIGLALKSYIEACEFSKRRKVFGD